MSTPSIPRHHIVCVDALNAPRYWHRADQTSLVPTVAVLSWLEGSQRVSAALSDGERDVLVDVAGGVPRWLQQLEQDHRPEWFVPRWPSHWERPDALIGDLSEFIDYLEQTDDTQWQTDVVRSGSPDHERNCVLGHLHRWAEDAGGEALASAVWSRFEELWATTHRIYPVNDGTDLGYPQSTPKGRVLAFLRDLRAGRVENTDESMHSDFLAYEASLDAENASA